MEQSVQVQLEPLAYPWVECVLVLLEPLVARPGRGKLVERHQLGDQWRLACRCCRRRRQRLVRWRSRTGGNLLAVFLICILHGDILTDTSVWLTTLSPLFLCSWRCPCLMWALALAARVKPVRKSPAFIFAVG